MNLRKRVDTLDGIEEAYRGLYTEVEGGDGYELTIDIELDEDTKREQEQAAAAARSARAERDKARKELRALSEGIKPLQELIGDREIDEVAELLEQASKTKDEALKSAGDWDKHTQKINERWEKKLAEETGPLVERVADLEGALSHIVLDGAIAGVLNEYPVAPQYLDPLRYKFRAIAKVDWDEGETIEVNGRTVTVPRAVKMEDGVPIPFTKWVGDSWDKTEEANAMRLARKDNGGGASGSGNSRSRIPNPYVRATLNLSEQGRIERDDPALARRFQAEAGLS